jgi:ABC-type amino acid transport substrate-binding protein
MKSPAGEWEGITIELWNRIADRLGLEYEFVETDLAGLLAGVADGQLDAAAAALTVTPEREISVDFSHPFHTTGLSIAVRAGEKGAYWRLLEAFLSPRFLKVVAVLAVVLLACGVAIWLVERKRNPGQFGGSVISGIASGFWWSAVTMTTVGYGDKAPTTFLGRLVAIVWMFTAIIVISSFTAAIASALTVSQLASPVQGPGDLPNVRVGSVANSTSATFLQDERVSFRAFADPGAGMAALAADEIDAMVYDAPILRYLVQTQFAGTLRVLPATFARQDYGIALRHASSLREPVNRALLTEITRPEWQDVMYKYLGAN